MAQIFDMGTGLSTITNNLNQAISAVEGVTKTASNIANTISGLGNVASVGGAISSLNSIVGGVKSIAGTLENITNPAQFASAIRSLNLPKAGETALSALAAGASFGGTDASRDWRVRLSVPESLAEGLVLKPLIDNGRQLIFPYTPTITLSGSANYEEQNVTHQNYQFIYYNSSKAEQIQIVAPFNVEDGEQALYWLAAVHFLRSATKMFTGNDPNAGNPPAICRLNGYGNYVFDNIPVVIKQFSFDLPQDVNYINAAGISWVPVKSTLNLTLQPIYSRQAAREFSLLNFVNGYYAGRGYV